MSNTLLLTLLVVIQQGLIALAWAAAVAAGASRRASGHYALAALGMGASLALALNRASVPAWTGGWLANLLAVVAMLVLLRGVLVYCKAPDLWRVLAMRAIVFASLSAALDLSGAPADWNVLLTSVLLAWAMVEIGQSIATRLRYEFGAATARMLALPFWLVGAALAARAVLALLLAVGAQTEADPLRPASAAFGVLFLAAMLVVNLTLGALIVLRLVRRLQHMSVHDVLTGVLNRRGFDEMLTREAERLRRYGQGFAVLSIDIDHFKAINDKYGHAVGDEVLVSVARALAHALRDVDRIGRVGGEEFCVLMPHSSAAAAQAVATRLLRTVREKCVGPEATPWRATVSIGVALAEDANETQHLLMQRLDRALYAAKERGRDRVEVAELRPARAV